IDHLERLERRSGEDADDLFPTPGPLLVPLVDLYPPLTRPRPPPHPRVPDPCAWPECRGDLQSKVLALRQERFVHAPNRRINLRIIDVEDEERLRRQARGGRTYA